MTENENIQVTLHCLRTMLCTEHCEDCPVYGETGTDHCEEDAVRCAIKALEEIQQYRALGTVDELKQAKAIENVYEQVKWERDVAISQLAEIGVGLGQKMDELKALKEMDSDCVIKQGIKSALEKDKPKLVIKSTYYGRDCTFYGCCPTCDAPVQNGMSGTDKVCKKCGQKLNW